MVLWRLCCDKGDGGGGGTGACRAAGKRKRERERVGKLSGKGRESGKVFRKIDEDTCEGGPRARLRSFGKKFF